MGRFLEVLHIGLISTVGEMGGFLPWLAALAHWRTSSLTEVFPAAGGPKSHKASEGIRSDLCCRI